MEPEPQNGVSDDIIILDKDKRIVASWGTVQVKDKEGQMLDVSSIVKHLRTMEQRGGGGAPIHYERKGGHGNKRVGKTIDQIPWRITKDGKTIPGVIVVWQVFKDLGYRIDDDAWSDVVNKAVTGLSLGGESYDHETKCNIQDPFNCVDFMKDIEPHEWTMARIPVNDLSKHITKSEFRKIVDELTLAGYDTGKVVGIAKSFLNIDEEEPNMDDETKEKIDAFAKAIDEKIDTLTKAVEDITKSMDYAKEAKDKKEEEDKKKENLKKAEDPKPAPQLPEDTPKPITKEEMEEIMKTFSEGMVVAEVKKQLEGTKTAQTDMPGTGNAAPVKKGEEPAKVLETPAQKVDPKDLVKDASKTKSTMPHPSGGLTKME